MSTQVLGGPERSRTMVALVAVALSIAILVLAAQATSIWSSRGAAGDQHPPAQVATMAVTHLVSGSQIPAGCWVKFGCHRGSEPGRANTGPVSGGQIPNGCRVKYGC